jgi:four helix bundle protein
MNNFKTQMSNDKSNPKSKTKQYDLIERSSKFGINNIKLAKQIPSSCINNPLVTQLIRSATSVGANYMEADGAQSKKDFQHKISICKKEAKETMHWLKMVYAANQQLSPNCKILYQEAKELSLIFSAIIISSKKLKLNNLNLN